MHEVVRPRKPPSFLVWHPQILELLRLKESGGRTWPQGGWSQKPPNPQNLQQWFFLCSRPHPWPGSERLGEWGPDELEVPSQEEYVRLKSSSTILGTTEVFREFLTIKTSLVLVTPISLKAGVKG